MRRSPKPRDLRLREELAVRNFLTPNGVGGNARRLRCSPERECRGEIRQDSLQLCISGAYGVEKDLLLDNPGAMDRPSRVADGIGCELVGIRVRTRTVRSQLARLDAAPYFLP